MRYVTVVILYPIPDVQHVFSSTPLAPVNVLIAGDRAGQSLVLAQHVQFQPRQTHGRGSRLEQKNGPSRGRSARGTRGGHAGRGAARVRAQALPLCSEPERDTSRWRPLSRSRPAAPERAFCRRAAGPSTRPEHLPPAERPGRAAPPTPLQQSAGSSSRAPRRRAGPEARDAPRG